MFTSQRCEGQWLAYTWHSVSVSHDVMSVSGILKAGVCSCLYGLNSALLSGGLMLFFIFDGISGSFVVISSGE